MDVDGELVVVRDICSVGLDGMLCGRRHCGLRRTRGRANAGRNMEHVVVDNEEPAKDAKQTSNQHPALRRYEDVAVGERRRGW